MNSARRTSPALQTPASTRPVLKLVVPAEDDLDRGILHTDISPALAWGMTIPFLALIFLVPLSQLVIEIVQKQDVQELTLFTRMPTVANLRAYEDELDRKSVLKQWIQPHLQLALSQHLSQGNTNVVLGRPGWLFYRPGISFQMGPGLLNESRLKLREKELHESGEKQPAPDPRAAIRAFDADCRKAGVHLVVVPLPDKAMLQPGELMPGFEFSQPVEVATNSDYRRFVAELRQAGVDVFDVTPATLSPGSPPRFLQQDTHWRPEWMETVALDLAAHLSRQVAFSAESGRKFDVQDTQAQHLGDLVDMLRLPSSQTLFQPEAVTIRRVFSAGSEQAAWRPNPDADVLILGDSFCNIYCAPEMGWGDAAGFPAQLARFLERDVDVIARNGSGASGTRRELARRTAPLKGKRVVIWQFAMRDLVQANWEVLPIPAAEEAGRPALPVPGASERSASGPLVVEATVLAISDIPQPYSVPYKDCLTYIKVRVNKVEGDYADDQMIAVFWGMRDNVLLPAAGYKPGQRLRLKVVSLREAELNLRTVRSADDLDDYERSPYFVTEEQEL